MSDISIRIDERAGRITLQRPDALNALTYPMVLAIEAALDEWRTADIDLVMIDAEGEKAFCAGGDIADMYASGQRGDLEYGRKFWRDEYRLNAKLFEYPKPVISFLQGFTMGGGVGVGCHGSHRIVCETSQIAMPECGIGLVPDVGGSLMLALAPGHLGYFLGMTGHRMSAADAILAGFADSYIPQSNWPDLKATLSTTGDLALIENARTDAPDGTLSDVIPQIEASFAGATAADIWRALENDGSDFAVKTLNTLKQKSPLAQSCAVQILHRLRSVGSIRQALDQEFRYTSRAVAQGDFIEGIRAAIIDKDRNPNWAHPSVYDVPPMDVTNMLLPLGEDALNWKDMP